MTLPKPIKFKVERYISGLSQFKKIDNPIKLSANESALGPSPKAIQAFEDDKNNIFKYPESDSESLREVLSKKFNIDPKRIICGSGSDQIFEFTCHLFLKPEDEVIVTEFGFIMHRIYASLHNAKVILAKEKNFKASVEEILKKVTNKTKIVFIANPNNPTGTYISKNEMLNLRKKLRSNILLVVDDAYFEFLNLNDFKSGLDLFKGWGYSSKEIIDAMYQTKPPFNVNRAALAAGIAAIRDDQWIKKAIEHNTLWSNKIFSVLKEYKIQSNEPSTNFFLMNFSEIKINSDNVFEKLANKRLILRKMIQYKIPSSLRITIGNEDANKLFIKSLGSVFK